MGHPDRSSGHGDYREDGVAVAPAETGRTGDDDVSLSKGFLLTGVVVVALPGPVGGAVLAAPVAGATKIPPINGTGASSG